MQKVDLVPLLRFFGSNAFEKTLRVFSEVIKLVCNFKHTLKAKFQNQWSYRICSHSLPGTLIISTLQTESTSFVEYESTWIDGLGGPSIGPCRHIITIWSSSSLVKLLRKDLWWSLHLMLLCRCRLDSTDKLHRIFQKH